MWRCDAFAAFAISTAVRFPSAISVNTSRSIAAASDIEIRAAQRSPTNFIGVTGAPVFFNCCFDKNPPSPNRIRAPEVYNLIRKAQTDRLKHCEPNGGFHEKSTLLVLDAGLGSNARVGHWNS